MPDNAEPFFAVLELMGHVRLAGKISEEERFGTKIGRIDVPTDGDRWVTIYFSGVSIYRMTPCDEATARAVAARSAPAPIQPYEMPRQIAAKLPDEDGDRVMSCGHTPEDCDCDPDDEEDEDHEGSEYEGPEDLPIF